jgi:hypothetical protein
MHNVVRCARMASDRSLSNRAASHASWANTPDRTARTAPARAAGPGSLAHWMAKLDVVRFANATDAQKRAAAESMRKAHYAKLAAKSAESRKRKNP